MGGKRPRQSHDVSALDGAGVASVAERHTRGTGVLRLSKTHRLEPGGSGPDATRTRLPHHGGGELPGMSVGRWGGRGDVLRGSHGDVAGAESGASSVERSTSEHGNRPWSAPWSTSPTLGRGLGTPSADRSGAGRSRRSSPRPGCDTRSHELSELTREVVNDVGTVSDQCSRICPRPGVRRW